MSNRAIHVTQTGGDTDGLKEFANGADSGIILPQGTTGQRESGATEGTIRYNTTIGAFEYTTGSDTWVSLGEAAADGSTKGIATFDSTEFSASSGVISIGTLDASTIADGSVTNAEFQYISTLSSNAQTQLDAKLPLAGGTLSGAVDAGDNDLSKVVLKDYAEKDVAVTSGTTLAIDLAAGNTGSVTLAHNVTDIDFTNVPTDGTATFTIKITQDGTGSRTLAINAITVNGGSTVTGHTSGNAGLTLSTAAASVDLVTFLFFDADTPLINGLLDFKNS
jgi:hypothetical protein